MDGEEVLASQLVGGNLGLAEMPRDRGVNAVLYISTVVRLGLFYHFRLAYRLSALNGNGTLLDLDFTIRPVPTIKIFSRLVQQFTHPLPVAIHVLAPQ